MAKSHHPNVLDRPAYLVGALAATLLLHVVGYALAARIDVRAFQDTIAEIGERHSIELGSVDLRQLFKREPRREEDLREVFLRDHEEKLASLLPANEPPPPETVDLVETTTPAVDFAAPPTLDAPAEAAPATSPPLELIALPSQAAPLREGTLPDVSRTVLGDVTVPSLTSLQPSPGQAGGGALTLGPMSLTPQDLEAPPLPPPPDRDRPTPRTGVQPRPEEPLPEPLPPREEIVVAPPTVRPSLGSDPTPNVLDKLIDVEVTVYRGPDGGGYFRAELKPNEGSDRFAAIPKDVLFLVDASASIGRARLRQFTRGIESSMAYLKPGDRFNLVFFRERAEPVFEDWQTPTADNLERAREALGKLRSSGKTDVYAGIGPVVQMEHDPARPYLVYLVTDGKSTAGNELENSIFLQRINAENRAGACIFTYSAGDEANLFLMEYLAYKNRGFSRHLPKLDDADLQLGGFVGNFAEVIVKDLDCRITGDLQGDLYPRQLQHLYRGQPLTVWGRFPKGADEVGIQVTGRNSKGETEELIWTRKLANARQGDNQLAREWAAQKLYYLVGEWGITGDPELRRQIDEMAKQYDIVVPY